MSYRRLLAVLLLLALLPQPAAAAEGEAAGTAVIVLDGSGSMWGTLRSERPAKFDLARQALRRSLASLSPRVRLGLMSFGQRRRADCSDVEVLAPPEAGPADRVLSVADKLNPKGKGPLSLALREAAKQVPAGEAGAIIAIHDGPDNCGQDPCAAAAEIAAANPRTRVFLIGLGLEAEQSQRHACVAAATGGKVLAAETSAELADAISEALTLANLEKVDPETGMAVPAPKAATPPPAPSGPPGLRLTAALSADGKPLSAAVGWTVAKADAPETLLHQARTRELAVDLAPGSYIVEARLGQVTRTQTVEVAETGPTAVKVALDAGLLNLKAKADRDGAALADPVVTIFSKGDADGAQRPVWIGREATTQVVLPAGSYVVRVEDGLAAEVAEVTLAAGAGADVSPVLGTGELVLSAVLAANGEPLKEVTYTIEEDDPDSPQGRREVARSADPAATFTLPAGTYYVTARSGAAEVHDRVALGSGTTVRHAVTFNLVAITVTATASTPEDGSSPASQPVVIRVLGAEGQPPEIARVHGAVGTFRLPPARYRIEAEVMGRNVKAAGIVDLTSGRGGGVQLKLEQGEVSVDARAAAGRHWRIKDDEGRTVLHAGRGNGSTAQLAPGRYVLIWDADERVEQPFELKAGERRQLTLASP